MEKSKSKKQKKSKVDKSRYSKKDLQTTVRNYVSGLRKALNIIAEEAII